MTLCSTADDVLAWTTLPASWLQLLFLPDLDISVGLPWWLRRLRICLQCRRPGFNPWVGKIPWRRQWLPTPVFSPGESLGQRSLEGYSPWGRKELDMIEQLTLSHWHLSSCLKMENFFFFYIGEQSYLVLIFIFKIYLFLIEGYLLYNIMLVSAIHQHDSVIGIHTSLPSWTSLPPPISPTPCVIIEHWIWTPCVIE